MVLLYCMLAKAKQKHALQNILRWSLNQTVELEIFEIST